MKVKQLLKPCLGYIIAGDLDKSEFYVRLKLKACDEVGIHHRGFKLAAIISESYLNEKIRELQNDHTVNGILVQLPLPE